ncbi:hypothetical protein L195_g030179 [Trifolium pratense]|uniref:Uncharacterized protein n=1 Tax=Trifolium pratense TaxID=57577 RepID=A0A2K3L6Y1_TRIPR|nr:hypothetical protein L195_g030179 [Trifolium pratense]
MFRTRDVRMNRDVLEVDCSRLSSVVRGGRNLSNKLRELLDEGSLDQVFVGGATLRLVKSDTMEEKGVGRCRSDKLRRDEWTPI